MKGEKNRTVMNEKSLGSNSDVITGQFFLARISVIIVLFLSESISFFSSNSDSPYKRVAQNNTTLDIQRCCFCLFAQVTQSQYIYTNRKLCVSHLIRLNIRCNQSFDFEKRRN